MTTITTNRSRTALRSSLVAGEAQARRMARAIRWATTQHHLVPTGQFRGASRFQGRVRPFRPHQPGSHSSTIVSTTVVRCSEAQAHPERSASVTQASRGPRRRLVSYTIAGPETSTSWTPWGILSPGSPTSRRPDVRRPDATRLSSQPMPCRRPHRRCGRTRWPSSRGRG